MTRFDRTIFQFREYAAGLVLFVRSARKGLEVTSAGMAFVVKLTRGSQLPVRP
jgi:hypothetical protein